MNNNIHANGQLWRDNSDPHKPGNYRFKVFLAMKLIAILLTAFCFQVSASVYSQGITIKEKNAPLEKVIKSIRQQSGYSFIFDYKYLKEAKPVNVDIQAKSLEECLEIIFEQQPFSYLIREKVIIISPKKISEERKATNKAIEITGKVIDKNNLPIPGVTVKAKGTDLTRITSSDGIFSIVLLNNSATLIFSFVGYKTKEVSFSSSVNDLVIVLEQDTAALQEVNIVSTGYERLPKERATGSFVQVDRPVLNRRVSTNIIDRLEGVASGVLFPNSSIPVGSNESPISVRGRSTIYATAKPLIVVDNFPFQGDIATINPNDIESITILKDAAAASIWGAFSGNGVIVINTKKGAFNKPLDIEYNGNVTSGAKPDLTYGSSFINTRDFIDLEKLLFSKGFYDSSLGNTTNRPIISPVVELLDKVRKGALPGSDAESQINALANIDYRESMEKYLYQNSLSTQHSISLKGGSDRVNYLFSGGYDYNRPNLIGNSTKRQTFNTYDTFLPIKNLELSIGLTYTNSPGTNNNPGHFSPGGGKNAYYPYMKLVDENGNPLPIEKDYRLNYIQTVGNGKLLNWT